jgi:transcription-repair coupling factor (superfamily II helicase)
MKISEVQHLYTKAPACGALNKLLEDASVRTLFLQGLVASSAPVVFSAAAAASRLVFVFVLQDADEAGYFYNDLRNFTPSTYFFPSSYRRAVKYGQRDAANEILRTEVLARLSALPTSGPNEGGFCVVTYPEAVAELVVSQQHLDERRISLRTAQTVEVSDLVHRLRDLGFIEKTMCMSPDSLPCAKQSSMSIPIRASCLSVSTSLATRSIPCAPSPSKTSFRRTR